MSYLAVVTKTTVIIYIHNLFIYSSFFYFIFFHIDTILLLVFNSVTSSNGVNISVAVDATEAEIDEQVSKELLESLNPEELVL